MNLKQRAKQQQDDIPALFLALKDKRTPWLAKGLAFLALAYALSPIDLIPDFIPVLGYLDDLLILPGLIVLTVKLIPRDLWREKQETARGMWQNGGPSRWYYSLPILLVWLLIIALLIKAFWHK